MFDVTHKYKGECMFFATVRPNEDHFVYLSAYGESASVLLEKYLEGQRADNEELFAKWDESFEKANSQAGFAATHEVEDGYVYISTYQSGIGISPGDELEPRKYTARGRESDFRISIQSSDLDEEMSEMEDSDE